MLYLQITSITMASTPTHPTEDRLVCPICLEKFTDPRMLPCLHTLCRHCIEGLVSASAQKVRCPCCRRDCQIPSEGLSGFQKNFFLNDLREVLQEVKELRTSGARHNGQTECDNTKHDKAEKRNLKCGEHPDANLDFYCDTCHVPVCAKCCLLKHKQHQYRDMTEVGEEYQRKLEEFIQAAEVHANKVRGQVKELEASQHTIQRDINKARQEVKKAANEMRDLATKREQYLLQQIQDIEQEALAAVTSAQEDTELKIATTESLLSYMQALHDSGDVTDQVVHTPDVEKQLHQQQAAPLRTVEWTASFKKRTNSVDTLSTMLGTVAADCPPATKEVKLGQPLNTLKTDLSNSVSGLVVVNGCVCAIAWWRPDLYIHNTATNVSKQWELDDLRAVGLAAIRDTDNRLVIADYDKKLHFVTFNQHSMKITRHAVKDITFAPRHISIHPITGQLVIADYTNKAIVVCDTQGNVQNTVTVQTEVGYMKCAVATDDDYIILDCSKPGRVHWVDIQGRVTHTYGNREGEGLRNPRHMMRSSWGQLMVADVLNSRLHLVDTGGRLSCYLLTKDDSIDVAGSVWLDETTSLLYTGHGPGGHGGIGVYKWPRQHGLQVTVGTYE